jgi:DNA-binding NarL/FixJ family response regulator
VNGADSLAIVLADVDALVTEGLANLLEQHGHRTRITAPTHAAVHAAVRTFGADVCIIDLALRDGRDLASINRLTADFPATRIIIRTTDPSAETMRSALAAGAAGYLHKSRGPGPLLEALTRVIEGNVVVQGSFARPTPVREEDATEFRRLFRYLTPRERECLQLIVEGQGTAAMAAYLGVSAMTVRSHVQSLLSKLGVHSRLEAVSLAARFPAESSPDPALSMTVRSASSSR